MNDGTFPECAPGVERFGFARACLAGTPFDRAHKQKHRGSRCARTRRHSMTRRFFGTDGVRGLFGGEVVNPAFVRRLAFAAGRVLHPGAAAAPVALVGRDTRASGEHLETAVTEGLVAAGWHVRLLGIVPTPAVALAVRDDAVALGVVLTASHNPAPDNGVKFFSRGGSKLDDATEARIEASLPDAGWSATPVRGVSVSAAAGRDRYVARMSALLPPGSLAGWPVAVDAANGATAATTPAVLRSLGAVVTALGCQSDGTNINAGVGSEHPDGLAASVLRVGARIGIAHDGDGDRVLLCDEKGGILDGDEILTILACHALETGVLAGRTLVITVQSNLGVDAAVKRAGGRVVRTDVGDRHVMAAMAREGAVLGGESSGHVILSAHSPTGDGLAAAIAVIRVMLATGRPLSDLRRRLVRFPQASAAIPVRGKPPLERCAAIAGVIRDAESALGTDGRVLVRYSGTEPKIRLLVEARDQQAVTGWMDRLREAVRRDLERM